MARLRQHWRAAGLEPTLVPIDNRASDDSVAAQYRDAVSRCCEDRSVQLGELVLGGFSRGARIAAELACESGARALLCLGYPFHAHGDAQNRHGLAILRQVSVPTQVVQGSRDAHGNREELRGYGALPSCIQLHWLEDANHCWQPRGKSGQDKEALIVSAADVTIDFIRDSAITPA